MTLERLLDGLSTKPQGGASIPRIGFLMRLESQPQGDSESTLTQRSATLIDGDRLLASVLHLRSLGGGWKWGL